MDSSLSVSAAAEAVVVVEKRPRLQPKLLQLKLTRVDISHLTLPRQFLSARDSHRASNCTTAVSMATSINTINLCPEKSEKKIKNSACLEALTLPLAVNDSSSHEAGRPLVAGVGRGRGRGWRREQGGVRIDGGKGKKIQNSTPAATKLLSTCVASGTVETLTEKPIETPHFPNTTKSDMNVTSSNLLLETHWLSHKSTNQLAHQSSHHSAYKSMHHSMEKLVLERTNSNLPPAPRGHRSGQEQADQSPQPGTIDHSSHPPGSSSLCQSSHAKDQPHSYSPPSLSLDYSVEEAQQKLGPREVVDKLAGPQEVNPTVSSLSPAVSGQQCGKRRRIASIKAVLAAMDSTEFFDTMREGRGGSNAGGAGASRLESPSPRCDEDSLKGRKRGGKIPCSVFSPPAKRRRIHDEVTIHNSSRLSLILRIN